MLLPRQEYGQGCEGRLYEYDGECFDGNPWFAHAPLLGSKFKDPYAVADIVLTCFFLLTLSTIAIWATILKKRGAISQSVLKWNKFGIAIAFALILYAFIFASGIISEDKAYAVNVYVVTEAILYDTKYIEGIFLLVTVYKLLFHCLLQPDQRDTRGMYKVLRLHYAFCGILAVLYITILALDIRDVVNEVRTEVFAIYRLRVVGQTLDADKLDIAFDALYSAATIEVIIGGLWGLFIFRRRGESIKAQGLFIALVSAPLLIRRIFFLGYDARFEIGPGPVPRILGGTDFRPTLLAGDIITGLCGVVVYGGIVFVATQLDNTQTAEQIFDQNPIAEYGGTSIRTKDASQVENDMRGSASEMHQYRRGHQGINF